MNPDDLFSTAKQLEFDLDYQTPTYTTTTDSDYSITLNNEGMYTFNTTLDTTFDADTYGRTWEPQEDPVEKRLQKIEKALAIIHPNEQLEEKYPHIKELREKYEQEVEAVMTFEYLEPKKTG